MADQQQRRIEIKNKHGNYIFVEDEQGGLDVFQDGSPLTQDDMLHPAHALFDEILAIGADLDEHVIAFKREEERGANLVRNWVEECDMRKEENATLQRRLVLVGERAGALQEQLARVKAKRAGDLVKRIDCPKCGSEYTAAVHARQDGVAGVLVVCIDCDELVPWRALTDSEIPKEHHAEPDPDGPSPAHP